MLRYYSTTLRGTHGSILPGASVKVTDRTSGALVTLVDPDDRTTSITNPVSADSRGFVEFVARTRGPFTLTISYDGETTTIEHQFGEETPVLELDLSTDTKFALTHGINYRAEIHDLHISSTDSIEVKFSTDGTTPVVTGYESRARYMAGDTNDTYETLTDACHLLGSETAAKGPIADTADECYFRVFGCVSGSWAPRYEGHSGYMDEDGSATVMDSVATVSAADYTHCHIVPNGGTITGTLQLYEA